MSSRPEFKLSDFTRTGELERDLSAAARRFFASEPNGGGWDLQFGGGRWELYPEAAEETLLHPSNNTAGESKIGCYLRGMKGAVIDGGGAQLMVRGTPIAGRGNMNLMDTPLVPFLLQNCEDVVLRNFSVDWETPFAADGEVLESQPGEMVVQVTSPHRWWTWNGMMVFDGEGWAWTVRRLLAVEPKTNGIVAGTGDSLGAGYDKTWTFEKCGEDTVRIRGDFDAMPRPGKGILFWMGGFNTADRRCPAMVVEGCRNVTLENITLHHAWGMGFLTQRTENITLRNCVVEPSGQRRFSLTADGSHFVNCKGHVEVSGCRMQNQFDDAVNVHGNFLQVVRRLNERTMRVRTGHSQHQGVDVIAPGETVEWLTHDTLAIQGSGKVAQVERLNSETLDLHMEDEIPELDAGDLMENVDAHPDITIRNNNFRWNRARGILINGRGRILVEGNRLEHAGAAILFETSPTWFESGRTRDITIRKNHFENCAHTPMWGNAVIKGAPGFPGGDIAREGAFHGKLNISENTFVRPNATPVSVTWFEAVQFKDNTIVDPQYNGPAVDARHCDLVEE